MLETSRSHLTLPCDIAPFVPHQRRMCLLDRLLDVGDEHLRAEVIPDPDDLFASDTGIPGWVGLEWLAQAVAAWAGVQRVTGGAQPAVGFLLGTRRYHSSVSSFAFDEPVTVEVFLDFRAENGLGAFRGQLLDIHNQIIATATLNVFQPDSDEALAAMQNGESP
ncbi:hypothetical protein HG264_09875 [Pseudomonas sp. gcc21]|uniref:ApeP family dehydratase n=1 Tax=Pseudomonas sp. gcc21 TaxID=2726989 RepID=UPI001451CA7C|nr:hypothetical protein [Pseudomonas sp. gcc21]QJD59191.1 hypothetical protein HG264_09875 [Pseudomonas sp. gcc21]